MATDILIPTDFLKSFLEELPQKLSTQQREYGSLLSQQLQEREELVLDLSSLQTSLDPMPTYEQVLTSGSGDGAESDSTSGDGAGGGAVEKFKYNDFVRAYFNTPGLLPKVETFKMRGLQGSGTTDE